MTNDNEEPSAASAGYGLLNRKSKMSKEDDDALCEAQRRHMEHPLRTDTITLIVKHRGKELMVFRSRLAEVFDRCEAVYVSKGEDDGDSLTAAYLTGVEEGKKIAKRGLP